MKNKHITLFPNKINKKLFLIDLTYGLGGYYNNNYSIVFDKNLLLTSNFNKKYNKNFFIFKSNINKIFIIIKKFKLRKINTLIYDQGLNSCEIRNIFYKFNYKNYINNKKKLNKNYFLIFNKLFFFFSKKFFLIINIFDKYEYYKIYFFIKKIKIFKIKILKLNFFEISLNNSLKKSKMIIIYV